MVIRVATGCVSVIHGGLMLRRHNVHYHTVINQQSRLSKSWPKFNDINHRPERWTFRDLLVWSA